MSATKMTSLFSAFKGLMRERSLNGAFKVTKRKKPFSVSNIFLLMCRLQ